MLLHYKTSSFQPKGFLRRLFGAFHIYHMPFHYCFPFLQFWIQIAWPALAENRRSVRPSSRAARCKIRFSPIPRDKVKFAFSQTGRKFRKETVFSFRKGNLASFPWSPITRSSRPRFLEEIWPSSISISLFSLSNLCVWEWTWWWE